jgi:hypothetical protein
VQERRARHDGRPLRRDPLTGLATQSAPSIDWLRETIGADDLQALVAVALPLVLAEPLGARQGVTIGPYGAGAPGESLHCWCRTRLATARLEVLAEPGCADHNLVQYHGKADLPLPDLLAEWLALA